MTLPIHNLPPHVMQRLTDSAKKHHRRERLRRWVERNLIAEDPRSVEEQLRDDNSRDRSGLCFLILVSLMVIVYAMSACVILF